MRSRALSHYASSNYLKHTSRNPLQRALIGRFQSRLADLIAPLPACTLLDAGCGEGFVIRDLRARLPSLQIHAIDRDYEALAMARRLTPDVSFQVGDLYALPYATDSFHLVLCTEVLEHLAEPGRALAELGRVATRYCLLSVPWEPLFSIANFLRGKNVGRWGSDEGHVQRWGKRAFARLVGEHLTIRYVGTSFPWIVVLAEI